VKYLSARERFPPSQVRGQVSDPMAPNGNPSVIFTEINMPSDLVELRGLEPLTPCLQNPYTLSETVSELGTLDRSIL
jgi:hypothetical protein